MHCVDIWRDVRLGRACQRSWVLYTPCTPLAKQNWVATAIRSQARAAVIGAVTPADRQSAQAVAGALREARPDLLIAFGGRYQPLERSAGSDAGDDLATIRLPVGLGDSVRALVAALDRVTNIGWRPSALK